MTWPVIFANLAAGNQPLSLFDTMFTQVAQMVAIPSAAAGTNAITLTPIGNAPALANYQNFSSFRFIAGATTTGLVTAQYQALGFLPVYLSDGATQATTGNIVINLEYVLVFAQFLNGGAGGFFLEAASVPAIPAVAGSALTNLLIVNNGVTPNTQINVSYDELVMNNLTGGALRATGQSFTINAASVGVVNGLDVGSLAISTWYAIYGISNGATNGGLLSTNFSTPAMPAGYTFRKRIGAFRTNASGNFLGVRIAQRRAQYLVGGNGLAAGLPSMITGTSGNTGTPTWTAVAVANFVPPSAIGIGTVLQGQPSTSGTGAMAAPNNSYGARNSLTNPPPAVSTSLNVNTAAEVNLTSWWMLESTNVYYAADNANSGLFALGWDDNI